MRELFKGWWIRVASAVLSLGLWFVMLRAMNPGLMADDSGETVATAVGLGIPHPPGYPLITLVGRLVSLVPLGTPAFRLNLLACSFTFSAMVFIVLACLQWLRRLPEPERPPSWMTAGMTVLTGISLLSCRSLFAHSLTAKGGVYTLTLLLMSILLWWRMSEPADPDRSGELPRRFALGLPFLWAVGMTNHWESQLLWIPFLFYWFRRKTSRLPSKTGILIAVFILLGCSLYLVLPLRACLYPDVDWGHAVTLKRFLWVLARGPYIDIERQTRPLSSYAGKTWEVLKVLGIHWWPGWALLAVAGIVGLYRNHRRTAIELALFYVPVVLAVIVVPNMQPDAYPLIHAYLVSTHGMAAFFGFCGVWMVLDSLRRISRLPALALVVLMAAGGVWMARTGRLEGKQNYVYADDFSVNILKGLPRNALILSEGDQFVMTLFYYQGARNTRRDIVHIPAIFLNSDWGVELAFRQLEEKIRPTFPLPTTRERLRFLLSAYELLPDPSALPTFYSLNRGFLDELGLGLDSRLIASGLVFRMVSMREPKAEPIATEVWNIAERHRMRNGRSLKRKDLLDTATTDFYRYYANQYVVAGNTLNQSGNLAQALEFYLKALSVYPFAAEAYSNMAVLYGKEGYLEMAQVLCQMAIVRDERYAGAHDNLGNVFTLMGAHERAVESYRRALTLKPGDDNTRRNLEQAEEQIRSRVPPPDWTRHPSTFYFAMGNESAEKGRFLMAEAAYRTSESVGYTYPDLYNNLGVILAQMGKDEDSEKAFLKAIERKGDFVEAYKNYGLLLVNQKRGRDARRIIGKGLKLSPENPELLYLKTKLE